MKDKYDIIREIDLCKEYRERCIEEIQMKKNIEINTFLVNNTYLEIKKLKKELENER
jgi:hypothetical protein